MRPPAERRSLPPEFGEVHAIPAVLALVDRLVALGDTPFVASWMDANFGSRARYELPLAVRMMRVWREAGRIDRARGLLTSLAPSTANGSLDSARLSIEKAALFLLEQRLEHVEAELRAAGRVLKDVARGGATREQVEHHILSAELECAQGRRSQASATAKLAEHLAERLDDLPSRASLGTSLGRLALRLRDPRAAVIHLRVALERLPPRSPVALTSEANMAFALAITGSHLEARGHAHAAVAIATELRAPSLQADAYDILGVAELLADRPMVALDAIDEGLLLASEQERPLRRTLTLHRTLALAILGRGDNAREWLGRLERFELAGPSGHATSAREDSSLEHEIAMASLRARIEEADRRFGDVLDLVRPFGTSGAESYLAGMMWMTAARAAEQCGDSQAALEWVEGASLLGHRHGWVYPERDRSANLWSMALRSGDSRVVRYAEHLMTVPDAASMLSMPPPSSRLSLLSMGPPSTRSLDASVEAGGSSVELGQSGDTLVYVTTPGGVSRVALSDVKQNTESANLVVDTLHHMLRIGSREVSLERRRALEPLVVALLRRAREGLSGDDILRAAGGPGPESADAEHRVRVLISRVRELFGDPGAIERVRDAGEHGKTRYRVAGNLQFALVEPLYSVGG
jgi:tetratricopeptide (TPR) repeat protein